MRGVLLASGGIDSTVLMYELAKKRKLGLVVMCYYGQKSFETCAKMVESHALELNVEMVVVQEHIAQKVQADITPGVFIDGFVPPMRAKVPRFSTKAAINRYKLREWSWIDGRNTLFFVRAAMEATKRGFNAVYTAFQFDKEWWQDPKLRNGKYTDTTPTFVRALNQLFDSGAFLTSPRVVAPYLDDKLDKAEIVRRGHELGIDLARRTYSCEFFPACRTCNQCQVRFDVLGVY